MSKVIDDTNLGKYFFEVRDQKTKRVLYSRGFASIYGEWETTDEAAAMMRTFSESLRFPAPTSPVDIVLKKRDKQNGWLDVWSTVVDPKDIFIDRSKTRAPGLLIPIQKMGEPAKKVDFLILGDGYTTRELGQGTSSRFQRLGALPARRREWNLPPVHRHLSRLAARRDLRCIRFRAICSNFRQPRAAQGRAVCPLRVHRDTR
jgi:hypothetical protein